MVRRKAEITEAEQADAHAPAIEMSAEQEKEFFELEEVVSRGQQTFVEVGTALQRIRDRKYYLQTHTTFEAYLKDRWGIARSRGYQMISAARTVQAAIEAGEKPPENERQARAINEPASVPTTVDTSRDVEANKAFEKAAEALEPPEGGSALDERDLEPESPPGAEDDDAPEPERRFVPEVKILEGEIVDGDVSLRATEEPKPEASDRSYARLISRISPLMDSIIREASKVGTIGYLPSGTTRGEFLQLSQALRGELVRLERLTKRTMTQPGDRLI